MLYVRALPVLFELCFTTLWICSQST